MHDALLGRPTKFAIRKKAVISTVTKGVILNCLGLGVVLVAMQALVAQLLLRPLTLPDAVHPLLAGRSPPDILLSSLGAL